MSLQIAIPPGFITEPMFLSLPWPPNQLSDEITQDVTSVHVRLSKGLGGTGVLQTMSFLYRSHFMPWSKDRVFGAAFMSVSRPPDGAARPQHFNNHK